MAKVKNIDKYPNMTETMLPVHKKQHIQKRLKNLYVSFILSNYTKIGSDASL